MGRRSAADSDILRCCFCGKSQDQAVKLISSPSDYRRAYICDECIATCHAILEDDRSEAEPSAANIEPGETSHPWATHPLLSRLLMAVERWMQQESVGGDAAAEIGAMREIADRMMRGYSRKAPGW